jgi:hypothetical protein
MLRAHDGHDIRTVRVAVLFCDIGFARKIAIVAKLLLNPLTGAQFSYNRFSCNGSEDVGGCVSGLWSTVWLLSDGSFVDFLRLGYYRGKFWNKAAIFNE